MAQSSRAIMAVAADVASVAAQVGKLREANVQHADAIASITGAVLEARGPQQSPARVEHA
jgi:hypothetical protein